MRIINNEINLTGPSGQYIYYYLITEERKEYLW
jgi:hypothetical protein